ncbi:hypothetical protein ACJJTC_009765 [Scirpophaga incertulas]
MPQVRLSSQAVALVAGLTLADPDFHTTGSIDLLWGADVLGVLLCGSIKVLQAGWPCVSHGSSLNRLSELYVAVGSVLLLFKSSTAQGSTANRKSIYRTISDHYYNP